MYLKIGPFQEFKKNIVNKSLIKPKNKGTQTMEPSLRRIAQNVLDPRPVF